MARVTGKEVFDGCFGALLPARESFTEPRGLERRDFVDFLLEERDGFGFRDGVHGQGAFGLAGLDGLDGLAGLERLEGLEVLDEPASRAFRRVIPIQKWIVIRDR